MYYKISITELTEIIFDSLSSVNPATPNLGLSLFGLSGLPILLT
jgi:hypothetical protein